MKVNEIGSGMEMVVGSIGESEDCDAEAEDVEEIERRAASKKQVVSYLNHYQSICNGVNILIIRCHEVLLDQDFANLEQQVKSSSKKKVHSQYRQTDLEF